MSNNTKIKNTKVYPQEFEAIINEKSFNFVGREFVFSAINNFINQYDNGYFTIVGEPGSGKSAIVAKYVKENKGVVYYNVEDNPPQPPLNSDQLTVTSYQCDPPQPPLKKRESLGDDSYQASLKSYPL